MDHNTENTPSSGFNLSAWAVRHQALVLFFIIMLSGLGWLSYTKLGRAEDPSFTIKVATITAVWPGSSAQEMQDQVTDLIEKTAQQMPYFGKMQTYTKPGFTAISLEFQDNTPPQKVPFLFYLLRKKLTDLRPKMPAGVLPLGINDEFGDVDSVLYALHVEGNDYATLKGAAEEFRKQLLKVPNVVKVNMYGHQDERIFVEISHIKLANLGIAPQAIFEALQKQNELAPAGVFESSAQRIPLRVNGAFLDAAMVGETPIDVNGRVIKLSDIATVTKGFEDPPSYVVRQRGTPAVMLGVVMATGANILEFGKNLEKTKTEFEAQMPLGFTLEQIADQPKVVDTAIFEFMKTFLEALLIVMAVSFLSLGWRTGIVVALSVPLVLGLTFIVMDMMGMSLHRITLGALIIALGLLVDDAIIAVEMMIVKMEQGWDRLKAASFAWESTAMPMLTGTLVTMAGFLPIGFADSAVGEYAGGIFWVVGIALVASWIVAVVFTPYLGVKMLPNVVHHDIDAIYHTPRYNKMRRVVVWCVQYKWLVALATFLIFAASIVGFGRVQQQFFPLSERPELFFEMRMPEGTSLQSTAAVAASAEKMVQKVEADVATYSTYIGAGSPRFWLGLNPQLPNEAFAQIVIVAKDTDARERIKTYLEGEVQKGALAAARVRVDRFNFGPPVGFPVQFRVVGPNTQKVREIAYKARDIMRQNKNVIDPFLDWNERIPSMTLDIDIKRARALGLTPLDVAQSLQTLVSGVPVSVVRRGTEQVQVVVRATEQERGNLSALQDLTIAVRNGTPISLAQVASFKWESEEPILWRRNRDMVLTVKADVVDGVQAPDATMQIWPALKALSVGLESGYRIEIGGAIEESEKGNGSIFAMFPLMLVAMLGLLMLQLQNFSQLFLVISTAPLGIVGASLALNLSNRPFGFVALLGLIALAGMIMRNTVILVDQIEHDVREGLPLREAIVEATVRRSRPVVLTALAAILAMIPLTSSAFWGPMATTIMGGLFVATFLTLLFLPALYAIWFRGRIRADAQKVTDHEPKLSLAAE